MHGKQRANQTHFEVGQKVRQTIQDLGGTMPESLPIPEQSFKQVESAKKSWKRKNEDVLLKKFCYASELVQAVFAPIASVFALCVQLNCAPIEVSCRASAKIG